MKITCLSAANISVARSHSASVKACHLIAEQVKAARPGAEVEIVALIDYEMKPCIMCGDCASSQRCSRDPAFNLVLETITGADALFAVIPHYAPFPSKVMILLEKIEEMSYLGWTNDEQHYASPLSGKPIGIIGHGGQAGPEAEAYYQKALVEPLAGAFGACGFRPVGAGEACPHGVSFGIRSLRKPAGSLFVEIDHDWDTIAERVAPLVTNVLFAAGQ